MNKISVVLLSCCLALSGSLALAQETMKGQDMNKGGMSMQKTMPGDRMGQDSMKMDSMKMKSGDKDTMKMAPKEKPAMAHKTPKKRTHKGRMEPRKAPDAMQRMQ